MGKIEDYSFKNIIEAIKEFKEQHGILGSQLKCYLAIYYTCLSRKNGERYKYYTVEEKNGLENTLNECVQSIKELISKIFAFDKSLIDLEKEINENRKSNYTDMLPDPLKFIVDKFDDVEMQKIAETREILRDQKDAGELENECLDEELLSNEDILGMAPPTIYEYQLFLEDLIMGKYPEQSGRMRELVFQKENTLISLELLLTKINSLDIYYEIYGFQCRLDKTNEIDERILDYQISRATIEQSLRSIRSKIGTEGKNIKMVHQKRIEYYQHKIELLKEKYGYGRKKTGSNNY